MSKITAFFTNRHSAERRSRMRDMIQIAGFSGRLEYHVRRAGESAKGLEPVWSQDMRGEHSSPVECQGRQRVRNCERAKACALAPGAPRRSHPSARRRATVFDLMAGPRAALAGMRGAFLLLGLTLSCGGDPAPDLVLYGGVVITIDEALPEAEAFLVREGRFAAVGSDHQMLQLAGETAQKVDLRGKTVVPGFNDAHLHTLLLPPGSVSLARATQNATLGPRSDGGLKMPQGLP